MLTHWNQFCFFGQVAPTNPIAGREWMGKTWWGALKLIQTKFMAIRTWKRRKELRPIPELLHVEMGKLEVICHCECFGWLLFVKAAGLSCFWFGLACPSIINRLDIFLRRKEKRHKIFGWTDEKPRMMRGLLAQRPLWPNPIDLAGKK